MFKDIVDLAFALTFYIMDKYPCSYKGLDLDLLTKFTMELTDKNFTLFIQDLAPVKSIS